MQKISRVLFEFIKTFELELPRHELLQVCQLSDKRLKPWMDAQIAKYIDKDESIRDMLIREDAIAAGMWRAYKANKLPGVHDYISRMEKPLTEIDLIEHAFERYIKLTQYVQSR